MPFYWTNDRSNHIATSIRILIVIFLILNVTFGTSVVAAAASTAMTAPAFDAMRQITFSEETESFVNPERGWYRPYKSTDIWGFDLLKGKGISVVLLEVDLKAFLTTPISVAKLDEIRGAFDEARKNGIQLMFRAAYDFKGLEDCEPKDLSIITGHIAQLKSIFFDYEDVLYCVQAGFLGPWGEWHSSYYGNPPSLEARKAVLFALMNAVPKSRSIQVRRPMFIRDIFAGEAGGNIITEETAFNGSNLSRTGYHDDALLSTADEYGTYVEKGFSRNAELNWVNQQNKYVPFGGETCYLGNNSNPDNAILELNKLHAQVVNLDYHPSVISKWKSTTFDGVNTFDYITAQLGYRFILSDLSLNTEVKKGGILHLNFNFKNEGFGNLINARNFEVVLYNGTTTYTAPVNDDPRRWYRENGVMNRDLYFTIPSTLASGKWNVYFNLANPLTDTKANADFSVRIANNGVWNATKGWNIVARDIDISASETSTAIKYFKELTRTDALLLIDPDFTTPLPSQTPEPSATPYSTPTPDGSTAPTVVPTATLTPTATATPMPTPNPIKAMTISNTSSYVNLRISGSNLNTKSQFFIDSDNQKSTGFLTKWRTSGFEYLIENKILYKYSGTNNQWKWTRIKDLAFSRTDALISVILPIKSVGLADGKVFRVGFISNDDRTRVIPALNQYPRKYTL
ncbi:MAG: DUF4832 domain-containing protein [Clostridia bacterium]